MPGIGSALMAAALGCAAVLSATAHASAAPCPDVEVVFARGTGAPVGIGGVGQAFVDALRARVAPRSVGVYAVDYPASFDFNASTTAGANDASAHVQAMMADCPATRIVLSGMSQGADVIDLITSDAPTKWGTPTPMPAAAADHVAAVAVFGNPSEITEGGPLSTTSRLYGSKTIDLCAPGDPVCSDGGNILAHATYIDSGMVDQAAAFAAGRL